MSANEKALQWDRALEKAQELFLQLVAHDAVSCGVAIRTYGKSKRWDRALGLLQEMAYELVKPNPACFHAGMCAGRGLSLNLFGMIPSLSCFA